MVQLMMWVLVWLLSAALVVSVVHGFRLNRELGEERANVAHLIMVHGSNSKEGEL